MVPTGLLLYCQIWGYCEFLQETVKYFKSYLYVKFNFSPGDFLPSLSNLSPTAEFSFRNYVTGLDIKSKYTQMNYLTT